MQKKIFIDLTTSGADKDYKYHGGNEYASAVVAEILKNNLDNKFRIELAINPKKNYRNIASYENNESKFFNLNQCNNIEELNELIEKINPDKYYNPLPDENINKVNIQNSQPILTIHGMRGVEVPLDKYEIFFKNRTVKYLLKKMLAPIIEKKNKKLYQKILEKTGESGKIIVVSNHTKKTLIKNFEGINKSNICMMYSPSKIGEQVQDEKNLEEKVKKYDENYYLIVSANRWEKNALRAIKAFIKINEKHPGFDKKLVVVGLNPTKELIFYKKFLHKNIEYSDYVSDAELVGLYKNADALIFPSLSEGFGYPPLEAIRHGTSVLASKATSIPEILGDAGIYFDPKSIDSIYRVIESFEENKKANVKKLETRYNYIKKIQNNDLIRLVNLILE